MQYQLLLIDCQNDFCHSDGALFVPGAVEDMSRLTQFIDNHIDIIEGVHATLDSHNYMHIAHPQVWLDKDGKAPNPFTIISLEDFETGVWSLKHEELKAKVHNYLIQLEKKGKYKLCIWPPHCLMNTWGHCMEKSLLERIHKLEAKSVPVHYHLKGLNNHTEFYSAIQAEVLDYEDSETLPNKLLMECLQKSQGIIIAGQALSHCVAVTVRDILNLCEDEDIAPKLSLLVDTMSNIAGFEDFGNAFLEEMKEAGVNVCTTETFCPK